jgi:spoIIIJ-associated protein
MTDRTDADEILSSLLGLLKNCAGLDVTAEIHHPEVPGESSAEAIQVELAGSDTPLLLHRDGELLHAIEHVASAMLRLPPEDRDRIAFDAAGFHAERLRAIHRLAEDAVVKVRLTLVPYTFPPMTARERRLLHLALAHSGLATASTGDHRSRSVVLYPDGVSPPPDSHSRG